MPVGTPEIDKTKYADRFQRGARKATPVNREVIPLRMPRGMAEQLTDQAWMRRTSRNALVVEILQQWLDVNSSKDVIALSGIRDVKSGVSK